MLLLIIRHAARASHYLRPFYLILIFTIPKLEPSLGEGHGWVGVGGCGWVWVGAHVGACGLPMGTHGGPTDPPFTNNHIEPCLMKIDITLLY